MNNKEIQKQLISFGLDEQEARVYLAGCQLGATNMQKLATLANIKRTTCYDIVRRLEQSGLFAVELKGEKKLYLAQPPEKLEEMLDSKKQVLSQILPDLNMLYQFPGSEETVKVVQGLTATKSIYNELLASMRPGDDYMVISAIDLWYQLDTKYFESFFLKRAEKSRRLGFRIRLLQEEGPIARRFHSTQKNYNAELKIFAKSLGLATNVVIVPKMLFIHQLKPPIKGFLFTNPYIIKFHQQIFEMLWTTTK